MKLLTSERRIRETSRVSFTDTDWEPTSDTAICSVSPNIGRRTDASEGSEAPVVELTANVRARSSVSFVPAGSVETVNDSGALATTTITQLALSRSMTEAVTAIPLWTISCAGM